MSSGKALTVQVMVIVCATILHLPVLAQDPQSDAPQSLALPKLKKLPSNDIYYPDDAKRMGAQGRVLLEFGIDDKGHATQIVIQKSDGDKILAKSAVRTLKGSVFDLSTVQDSEGRAGHPYRLSFVFELTRAASCSISTFLKIAKFPFVELRSVRVKSPMLIRAIAAFVALPGIVAFIFPISIGISTGLPAQYVAFAAAPLCIGIFLLFWCVHEFYVNGRGTLAPWDPPQHLVTTGPYRVSRNPMYIGVVTILLGWCALWGSRTQLIIYTFLVMGGFHLRVLLSEEPWAARQFGAQCQAYRARVPLWLL